MRVVFFGNHSDEKNKITLYIFSVTNDFFLFDRRSVEQLFRCILRCILLYTAISFSCSANRKILLNLQECVLLQRNQSFSDICVHVNHVRRIRKKKHLYFADGQDYFSVRVYTAGHRVRAQGVKFHFAYIDVADFILCIAELCYLCSILWLIVRSRLCALLSIGYFLVLFILSVWQHK